MPCHKKRAYSHPPRVARPIPARLRVHSSCTLPRFLRFSSPTSCSGASTPRVISFDCRSLSHTLALQDFLVLSRWHIAAFKVCVDGQQKKANYHSRRDTANLYLISSQFAFSVFIELVSVERVCVILRARAA
ncbi:hypothetical protein M413DRAFT_341858 [Hebeloma cylindrosporum]|uniref:Uncharacterized protein n=1 Tax=Hebeloma cylindrosporum TaxID=76867 RepID=A0A0C3CMZ2_HEBCY|nr:hypothetical protein M413DRAFT_341858 [Hebeloma cylindrosporum h7]